MSWNVTLGGRTYSSLDLTLDEVEALERISGQPWTVINPFAGVKSAKAYLAVFAIRDGRDEAEIVKSLDSLTLRELADSFEWVDDTKPPPKAKPGKRKGKALDPPSADRSSPNGSTSGRSASNGPQPSPDVKPSGTSTSS